jgi:integrase
MGRPKNKEIVVGVAVVASRKYIQMRYTDPETGKPVTKSTGTVSNAEADIAAANWQAELRANPVAAKTSWQTFRDAYFDECVSGMKHDTRLKVESVFNAVERHLNPKSLADLTAKKISELRAALRKEGRKETTIAGHMAHLKAALNWAAEVDLIAVTPKFPSIPRAKTGSKARVMKGRPITLKEFGVLLKSVPEVVGASDAKAWQFFLRGLWLSGLRLEESREFWWDRTDKLHVDFSGTHPVFRVFGEDEKGGSDRYLPMAPDFADFLAKVPKKDRTGLVFPLPRRREKDKDQRISKLWVSKTISLIGEKAGIIVDSRSGKYASAHDLRRSFGERWAPHVQPQVLMQLMRHANINTTLRFYALLEAQSVSKVVADLHRKRRVSGDSSR